MEGISMKELYEYLSYNRDIEFIYNHIEYVVQTEYNNNKDSFVIYKSISDTNSVCIARIDIEYNNPISKKYIDNILSIKCFDGKSFLDI